MSPIIIFAYSRPEATRRLVDSLLLCPETKESELYVFVDGLKGDNDAQKVQATQSIFEKLEGFKSKHLFFSPINKGLATSVIDGVSQVLAIHDRVIVLEDDLLVAPDFLSFMNQSLDIYQNRNDIWSISGYTPQLDIIPVDNVLSTFLVPRAQSWGYATWKDRWSKVDWSVTQFSIFKNRQKRDAFNLGGNDLYRSLDMQVHGKIESWAIRFAFAGFMENAWTVNPMGSKVKIQQAPSTTRHKGWHDSRHDVDLCFDSIKINPDVQPDEKWIQAFKHHHDLGWISKAGYFMRRHNLGYHFIKNLSARINS